MSLVIRFILLVAVVLAATSARKRCESDAPRDDAASNLNQANWHHGAMFSHGIGLQTGLALHDPFEMARRDEEQRGSDFLTEWEAPKLHMGLGTGLYDENASLFGSTDHLGGIGSSSDLST